MKNYFYMLIGLVLVAIFCDCSDNKSKKERTIVSQNVSANSASQNLNISVFLDISDRIDPRTHPNATMEYYERDLGYIQSIEKAFVTHVSNKKVVLINDALQVFLDPAPADKEINQLLTGLRISLNKDNVSKEMITSIGTTYSEYCEKIYKLAIENNNFVGSDIWGFMKNKVKDYCIKPESRNILVILTDGYIFHKDNKIKEGNRSSYITPATIRQLGLMNADWKSKFDQKDIGFITANKEINDLEVLVLGINPAKNSPYEQDIIEAYWKKWLDEMGVKKHDVKFADLPVNMNGIIGKFILEN